MNKSLDIKSSTGDKTLVSANYTKLSENIRRYTPQGIQCSVFCGGINCKYENPENWTADSLALQGIYSHWITDDILAMARPSTSVIIKKNIIQQFQSLGIRSIINLQSPKEHASCGEPLEESGFSYNPNLFMENNIYYYNFAWKDYGDASLSELLNMVKVLAFAITEGRVAIHCHAGLGRTGVLIACYLVYSLRVTANDAIRYVRLKRPGSVQTRGQIICVRHFAQFILPQNITYYIKESRDKYMSEFTLRKFLRRQKIIFHGYDERHYRYLPKIIHILCEQILKLCGCHTAEFFNNTLSIVNNFLYTKLNLNIPRLESKYNILSVLSDEFSSNSELMNISSCSCNSLPISPSPSDFGDTTDSSPQFSDSFSDISILDSNELKEEINEELLLENRCFQELQTQKEFDQLTSPKPIYSVDEVVSVLLTDFENMDFNIKQDILRYQNDINNSQMGWHRLRNETSLILLTDLLYGWLENLKTPVLGKDSLELIVIHYHQPEKCFQKFNMEEACLIEYLLNFLLKLHSLAEKEQENLLLRIIASLTQQTINIKNQLLPTGKNFQKLREGTLSCTKQFFKSLLPLIESHHAQNVEKTVTPNFEDVPKESSEINGKYAFP